MTPSPGVSGHRPVTPQGMDPDATADGPALSGERPREYAQWLTCTACAVADRHVVE